MRGSGLSESDDVARVSELERYIKDAKWAEVEPLLTKYVEERPKSSWGWYALGYTYFAQKKIGESIKALARSLQLDLKNAESHKILGRNLMIIGRFDAAQIEFEQAIRYQPDSAESHYNLGNLFSIQDNWEPARKAFEDALRIDPSYLEALDGLGFALEALGDDTGAIAKYQEAIRLNEARGGLFASAHVNLSAYFNRTGDPAKALDTPARRSARSQVRSGVVSEGEGRRTRGTLERRSFGAEHGDLLQPAGGLLLVRAGRGVSTNGLDRRQPEGAGGVQAPRARIDRPGEEASQRSSNQAQAAGAGA